MYSAVYVRHLLSFFASLDPSCHPWWWPRNGGRTLEDWGLTAEAVLEAECKPDLVLGSLRLGPQGKNPPSSTYAGFPGSIVLQNLDALIWVLSSRPSRDPFPNGATTTNLYRVLQRMNVLSRVHVADFVKFRGPGPDSKADVGLDDPIAGIDTTLRQVSLDCLKEEWEVAPPTVVLVSGFKTQKWVKAQMELSSSSRFAPFLKEIYAAMVPVKSWMAHGVKMDEIVDEWSRAIDGHPAPARDIS